MWASVLAGELLDAVGVDNAAAQCRNCNMRHEYDWEPMRAAYVAKYGQEQYDKVYK